MGLDEGRRAARAGRWGALRAKVRSTPRSARHTSEHTAPDRQGQRHGEQAAVSDDGGQPGRVARRNRPLGQLLGAEDRQQREGVKRGGARKGGAGG